MSIADQLAPFKFIVDWLAVGFGLLAALFWLSASIVKTPTRLRHLIHYRLDGEVGGDLADLAGGIAKQSRRNSWAAVFACVAVACQALSTFIGLRWD